MERRMVMIFNFTTLTNRFHLLFIKSNFIIIQIVFILIILFIIILKFIIVIIKVMYLIIIVILHDSYFHL